MTSTLEEFRIFCCVVFMVIVQCRKLYRTCLENFNGLLHGLKVEELATVKAPIGCTTVKYSLHGSSASETVEVKYITSLPA